MRGTWRKMVVGCVAGLLCFAGRNAKAAEPGGVPSAETPVAGTLTMTVADLVMMMEQSQKDMAAQKRVDRQLLMGGVVPLNEDEEMFLTSSWIHPVLMVEEYRLTRGGLSVGPKDKPPTCPAPWGNVISFTIIPGGTATVY